MNNSENNNTDSLSSSPVLPKGLNYLSAAYNYNDILSRVNLGHRQSSSYDTSLIDTSEVKNFLIYKIIYALKYSISYLHILNI